ncbi:MAG TPA: molybdopterin-dependent oxidoreductase [Thermomicrobiales bacterium]|jgi:DMSO/TMAO reductase YedYZ molybdopterin-dependent catalytic subunit|nr:molybdopterin-dependent oxidoreductase [Thermomicrobiales bacterium]
MTRGLPLENALNPNVLVALQMNGTDILNPHGGPLRLVVPGWGGITSIKWLASQTVIDQAFDGTCNTESYARTDETELVLEPVWQMPVKSVITNILPESEPTAGPQTIAGYAWSGYGMVKVI